MKESKDGCFIGYDKPFQFYVDTTWSGNPLKDNTARLSLEPFNLIPISLIKGNSADDANKNSKNNILKNIKKSLRNRKDDGFQIASALWNNYSLKVGLNLIGYLQFMRT